jgi:Protein of unknown function (DUF2934)
MSNRTAAPATQTQSSMTGSAGQSTMAIPHEKIARRAYEKWCMGGCMHGTDQQHWLDAEAELRAEMTGGKPMQSTQQTTAARPAQAMPAPMPQKSAQRR